MSASTAEPTATSTSTAAASAPGAGATSTPVQATSSLTAASPSAGAGASSDASASTHPAAATQPATTSASTPAVSSTSRQKLVAVAFHTLDPSSKQHRLRPAVSTSSSKITSSIIASSPSAASDHSSHGVVAAFNAATDLVMYLDEQLARPPTTGETITGLFRPASAELGGRLKKLGDKVERGKIKVPVGKGGAEWEGDRRVAQLSWEEFGKVFGQS